MNSIPLLPDKHHARPERPMRLALTRTPCPKHMQDSAALTRFHGEVLVVETQMLSHLMTKQPMLIRQRLALRRGGRARQRREQHLIAMREPPLQMIPRMAIRCCS